MTALEIAKQKAAQLRQAEKDKRDIERRQQLAVQKTGDVLAAVVGTVLLQFQDDFDITLVKDKIWKLQHSFSPVQLYVILRYDTRAWKGSDESLPEPFNQWVVEIEVPDYKNGKYNPVIGIDTRKDFYCCYLLETGKFEKEFGEYMAKYY